MILTDSETFFYSNLRKWIFGCVGILVLLVGLTHFSFFIDALMNGPSKLFRVPAISSLSIAIIGAIIILTAWDKKKWAFFIALFLIIITIFYINFFQLFQHTVVYKKLNQILMPQFSRSLFKNSFGAGVIFLFLSIALLCNNFSEVKQIHLWITAAVTGAAFGLALFFLIFNFTTVELIDIINVHLTSTTSCVTSLIALAILMYSGSRFAYRYPDYFSFWIASFATIAAFFLTIITWVLFKNWEGELIRKGHTDQLEESYMFSMSTFQLIIGLIFSCTLFWALYSAQIAHRKKKEADRANKDKTMFLANMSHEIRTPLHGIIGSCSLLELSKLDEYQKKWVAGINRSGKMLLELVDDLLDLSKIEANTIALELLNIHLKTLLDEVVAVLTPAARAKNLDLLFNYSPTLPENFLLDGKRIRQIVFNLLDNAIKFTEKGYVKLSVTASQEKNPMLVIQVEDTGIGIPKERLKNIFNTYLNLDIRTLKGSGLGLAITKRLVGLMNGWVGAESELNKGSVFIVKVPINKGENGVHG